MASYKSGFDPPTRPGDATRSRRLGTYMQPGSAKLEHREADIAHISGQMEPRRGPTPVGRIQQTGLPRPSMRSPSPNTRSIPETKPSTSGSRFGFGRTATTTALKEKVPELRGKSSRNVLRRKPSSIAQNSGDPRSNLERSGSTSPSKWSQTSAENRPSIEASLKSAEAYNEIFTRTRAKTPVKESPPIIPELDRYRARPEQNPNTSHRIVTVLPHKLSTQDLPPPTPLLSGTPLYSGSISSHHRYSGYSGSGYSASPSTRFSESPGPGAYSRDTTPTSMSSQSPGIIALPKTATPRLRQGSPAQSRPPVTRRRAGSTPNDVEGPIIDPHGLPSLRESLTSSSSNSTVKGEKKVEQKAKEKKKKKRLSPLPPSPPPRKSSQKFKKPRSTEHESPSKASQTPAKPIMTLATEESPSKPRNAPAQAPNKSTPPMRPSRDGAPDLQAQLGESMAVIQSNLAGFSFPQNKRSSALPLPRSTATSPPQQYLAPRSQQSSRLHAHNPSPSPVQPSPREATPAPAGLGIIPDLKPSQVPRSGRSPVPQAPTPNVAAPKHRFGLFGRRTKTTPEVATLDSSERAARKGPAAGTGHEGYGRYSRGRSSSAGGLGRGRERSMSAASSSQDSFASTRTHDPFLLERMSPVIIAGGGEILENRNASSELSRTESNTSLLLDRPSMDSKGSSNLSVKHEGSRTTLWPSALSREPEKRASILSVPKGGRRPSDSSDDGIGKSSLAFRRSIQRLNNSATALHLPRPLNIPVGGASPSMTSLDASIMSDESQVEIGRGRMGQLVKPKKLEKRAKSPRKWNFFRSDKKPKPDASVSVTVGRPPVKPIPHYAMLDSSDEQQDYEAMDMEDILREADVVDLSNEELDLLQFGESRENLRRMGDLQMKPEVQHKKLAPAPILFSSPEPMQITPEAPQTELHLTQDKPVRPSRLPQVGRIPKVVSARPEATSPKSFSRPFARLSTLQPLLAPIVLDKDSIALGPSPPKPSTPEPEQTAQPAGEADLRKGSIDSRSEATAASHQDFLAFSPRKDSEATTSSSGGLSFAGTTAVIPEPDAELAEDEVWDEYDDLIENPEGKIPVSATSSHGHPFQYQSYESRRVRKSKMQQPKESPTLNATPRIQEPAVEDDPPRKSILTLSSVYSQDMSPRLKNALTTIPTPTTPMSFTDFFSGYGDRNNSVHGDSAKKARRTSQSSSRKSRSSSSHSRSLSGLMTIAEQENNSPISQVNLRVGSMTVSKWLTFGHVLFSPAREAVMGLEGQSKRHSILVIDGLGNGKPPALLISSKLTLISKTTGRFTPPKPTPHQPSTTSPPHARSPPPTATPQPPHSP